MSISLIRNLIIDLRDRFENDAAIHEASNLMSISASDGIITRLGSEIEITFLVIKHIIDTVSVLKGLTSSIMNLYQDHTSKEENATNKMDEYVAGVNICVDVFNAFSAEIGKILVLTVQNNWSISNERERKLADVYLSVSQTILKQFPELAERRHPATGQMLLHHISKRGFGNDYSYKLMKSVINAAPAACSAADQSLALPLHFLMRNSNASISMLELLLETCPAALQATDQRGLTPLHWAAKTDDPNLPLVQCLFKKYRHLVIPLLKKRCHKGWLPLHYCCYHRSPDQLELFQLLLPTAYDREHGAVSILNDQFLQQIATSSEQYLPIHTLLLQSKPDLHTLHWLITTQPGSLRAASTDGSLPLHIAVSQEESDLASVKMLLDSYPDSIKIPDGDSMLPLHLSLATSNPNHGLMLYLLNLYPDAVFQMTEDGLLPLHVLMYYSKTPSISVIRHLVELYPNSSNISVVTYDRQDKAMTWTPLTLALSRKLQEVADFFLNFHRYDNIQLQHTVRLQTAPSITTIISSRDSLDSTTQFEPTAHPDHHKTEPGLSIAIPEPKMTMTSTASFGELQKIGHVVVRNMIIEDKSQESNHVSPLSIQTGLFTTSQQPSVDSSDREDVDNDTRPITAYYSDGYPSATVSPSTTSITPNQFIPNSLDPLRTKTGKPVQFRKPPSSPKPMGLSVPSTESVNSTTGVGVMNLLRNRIGIQSSSSNTFDSIESQSNSIMGRFERDSDSITEERGSPIDTSFKKVSARDSTANNKQLIYYSSNMDNAPYNLLDAKPISNDLAPELMAGAGRNIDSDDDDTSIMLPVVNRIIGNERRTSITIQLQNVPKLPSLQ